MQPRAAKQTKNNRYSFETKQSQGYNNESSTQLGKPNLIRSDIFLIKVKVNKIRVEHKTQKDTPCEKKQINGNVSLKIIEKNPYYLTIDQFKQKFHELLKFDAMFKDDSKPFILNQNQQSIIGQFEEKNIEQKQQQKIRLKKIKKLSKVTKQSFFKMIFSSFEANSNTETLKQIKSFSGYEQGYRLQYKRFFEKNKEKKQQSEEQQEEQINLTQTNRYIEKTSIIDSRPNLNNLFQENDLLIFSGTEDSVFQLQFEEQALDLHREGKGLNKSENQKQKNFNIFWSKFRLKNFSEIPFTQHQVTAKLFHKLKNEENQYKKIPIDKKINIYADLSFFFVPSNTNGWGILKIDEIAVKCKEIGTKSKQLKKLLKIRLEFPDVIERNKRLIEIQKSEIEMKVLTVDSNENSVWTDDIFIKINPQRNKVRIMFLEMEENNFDVKSIIGIKTIYLLQEGFLFDRIESTRHILLKSQENKNSEGFNVADMIINFCFEMSVNDEIAPQKLQSNQNNTFLNHFRSLL